MIKIVPKDVIKEDIYLYIHELSKDVLKYLVNIISKMIDGDKLDSYNNLERIIFEDEEIRNEIFTSLNKNFEFLNNDKLLIIKDIIDNYNKHYLIIIKMIINDIKMRIKSIDLNKKRKFDNSFDFYEKRRNYSYVYKI